jgi:hypothetical protein
VFEVVGVVGKTAIGGREVEVDGDGVVVDVLTARVRRRDRNEGISGDCV